MSMGIIIPQYSSYRVTSIATVFGPPTFRWTLPPCSCASILVIIVSTATRVLQRSSLSPKLGYVGGGSSVCDEVEDEVQQ